jgi:hypothetical protein
VVSGREHLVDQLLSLVDQLLVEVTSTEDIDWRPARDGLALTGSERLPKPRRERHTSRLPGLITQLAEEAGTRPVVDLGAEPDPEPRIVRYDERVIEVSWNRRDQGHLLAPSAAPRPPGAGGGGGIGRSQPGSRTPPGTQAAEALIDLGTAIEHTWTRARTAAGLARGPLLGTAVTLRAMVGLATQQGGDGLHVLPVDDLGVLVREARSWVESARVALHYSAPVIQLPDLYCPDCGQHRLRTRADASTDVWCAATAPLHGPPRPGEPYPLPDWRCGAKWPRHTWVQLLDQITREDTA